jgi:putative cell wall-binding protein
VKKQTKTRYWSGEVTRNSNALDLESDVFKQRNPRRIALSLKRSADASRRRKGTPYQSAMSMLNFYMNRAGSGLAARQKDVLTRAKAELRKVFHRGLKPERAKMKASRPR